MASFVVKQMVGNKMGAVKGAMGGGDDTEQKSGANPEEEAEIQAAREEAEERRKEKHRKMEAEREKLRQGIRDKYNIQAKDDSAAMNFDFGDSTGRIGAGSHAGSMGTAGAPDDSFMGQVNTALDKTKTAITDIGGQIKNLIPFGK